jgi:hypothetical protein
VSAEVGLIVVSIVGFVLLGVVAELGHRASRASADQTRAQMHSALVDERTLWLDQARAWQEERRMLLERLSDREGRQVAAFMPVPTPATPVEHRPVEWDPDLQPFDFEKAVKEQEEGYQDEPV